jgi:hypothetical protein
VLLLVAHHLLEDGRRAVVAELVALLGRGVELRHRRLLAVEGQPQHLLGLFADADRVELLHVGVTVEQQDPVDQCVGVAHLVDGQVVEDLAQAREAPVVEHPRMQEVGVGDGELEGEGVVEQIHHARANWLHLQPPVPMGQGSPHAGTRCA